MEKTNRWQGELVMSQGWAHYRGPAGDTSFHCHYPHQLVFSGATPARVLLEDGRVLTGSAITVSSNISHRMVSMAEPVDLLFIEPTLLNGLPATDWRLDRWLSFLRAAPPANIDSRIVRALTAIDGSLDGKINQQDIAREAGLSTSRFAEMFRQATGLPLRRYVLWRRLNVAVMAIGRDETATAAAHRAGFADSAHFSRNVRETFGVSPKESFLRIRMIDAPRRSLHREP